MFLVIELFILEVVYWYWLELVVERDDNIKIGFFVFNKVLFLFYVILGGGILVVLYLMDNELCVIVVILELILILNDLFLKSFRELKIVEIFGGEVFEEYLEEN